MEAKLYINEIKRIMPGQILEFNKTIEWLKNNYLINVEVTDMNKNYLLIKIPDEELKEQKLDYITFYINKQRTYGVFLKNNEWVLQFQKINR
jgi:hypothetical protein